MPGIYHNFIIKAATASVFKGISSPAGLDSWWTKRSSGKPVIGNKYKLDFGPEYQWEAIVIKAKLNEEFELHMTKAGEEWEGTIVGFKLGHSGENTMVSFYHQGWKSRSENYKFSSYCWAMYLRILKRNIEYGEKVPYNKRLDV